MKKIIAIIIVIISVLTCGCAISENLFENLYYIPAVVIGWERIEETNLRIIECLAEDGNVWSFYDNEETYHIEDKVLLTMRRGVKVEDDQVIDAERIRPTTAREMLDFLEKIGW